MTVQNLPALPLSPPRAGSLSRLLRGGTAVFLAVLVLRLWNLLHVSDSVHALPTDGDMKFYSDWGLRIARGQWTDHQAFYGQPLYAYLLAAVYKVFGFQPYIVLFLQALAEATTAGLIFQLAPLAFSSRTAGEAKRGLAPHRLVGYLAAAGWAFFVPAEAYSVILMPTTCFVTAFWLVVWWLMRERADLPRRREFFLLGLFMGVVAMMTANILFLSGLVLAAVILRRSWSGGLPAAGASRWFPRAAAAGLLLGGIALGTSPCWLHNYRVAGEPVLLSAHSGINFWIGNNPEATGYPKIPGGLHADQAGLLRDSITIAEKEEGRPLRRYEVSRHWSERAHRYIAGHPGEFAGLLVLKLFNFWNHYRYDDLGVIIPMQEDGMLLPGIGFGIVAALGLPGLLLAVVRRPRARWIAAAVLLHMASLLTVFVTERYRMAAVPGLLLLGSFGVVEVVRWCADRRWVETGAYAGLLTAATVFVFLPPSDKGMVDHDDYNSAIVNLADHRYDRARPKLERVCARNPNNPEAFFAMGNLALAEHNVPLAMRCYQRTIELDPGHARAMNNLGVIALDAGQWQAARGLFTSALKTNSQDAKLYYLLARARLALHDLDGARDAIGHAIQLAPDRTVYHTLNAEIGQAGASAGS